MDSGITVYIFKSFEGRKYQGEGHYIRMRDHIPHVYESTRSYARDAIRSCTFNVVNCTPPKTILLSSQRQDNLKHTSKLPRLYST